MKIVGRKDTPLHFCGLKVWAVSGEETFLEEHEADPEPIRPLESKKCGLIIPKPVEFE